MRTQLALTLVVSAGLVTLAHAQSAPGAAQTETVGGAQSIGIGSGAASPQFNPAEFTLKKNNGPHTGAAPAAGQSVPRYHFENAWPQKVESAPKPVVQPPPTPRAPVQGWPAKIEGIGIKQTIRR